MKNKFKKSLLVRIVAFQLIIGVIPLLFLGFASIFSVNNVLKDEAINYQEDNIRQGTININEMMGDVESLITNLSGNDEVNNALSSKTPESSYAKLTTQAKIGYILSGYSSMRGLISIDLFTSGGIHYHVGETLTAININNSIFDELSAGAKNSEDFVYWSGIESNINLDSEFANVITVAKILHAKGDSSNSEDSSGLLVVSYNPSIFDEAFGEASDQKGYTIILDSKSRIVYHPNSQYIGQALSDDLSSKIKAQTKGNFTQKIDGKNMLVIYDSAQKSGWIVAKFIPLESILSNGNIITIIFIILIILSIAITSIFALLMSRQIIQPIKKVTDTFRLLQSGDFSKESKLTMLHQDEIGELGNLFNSFIDAREDITMQKKLERQLNQQNQELQDALKILTAAQERLVQQEKMAGIGLLASGVAHEINNPINGIINYADLMKEDPTLNEQLKEYAVGIMHEGQRIAEIVKNLLSFSRQEKQESSPAQIGDIINQTISFVGAAMRLNQIKLEINVPEGLPDINCRSQQLQQVLLNLLTNARDSLNSKYDGFNENKKIIISCEMFEKEGRRWLKIIVEDNGTGMPEDILDRVFDPFFTTKSREKGTGLGLSISHGIVMSHHGDLYFETEQGEYTRAIMVLPVDDEGL
ncbi:MAG: ATP-binding protein [Eubacteriales bacterium]